MVAETLRRPQQLSITADQQKKMDGIFQQNRLTLADLNASLQRAEIGLESLLAAAQPDEPNILAQIDRAAQARTEWKRRMPACCWGFVAC
jgi:Spy/CpxP family protein refolding chaperone